MDDVHFLERWVLGSPQDRQQLLRDLTPRSKDFYYFSLLQAQLDDDGKRAMAIMNDMPKGMLEQQMKGMGIRTKLCAMDTVWAQRKDDPAHEKVIAELFQALRQSLNMSFNHHKQVSNQRAQAQQQGKKRHSSKLGADLLDLDKVFQQYAFDRKNVNAVASASALGRDWLAAKQLDADQLDQLLRNVNRPDMHNLVECVAADLEKNKLKRGMKFGARSLHRNLTLAQLVALRKLRPEVADTRQYVEVMLGHLQPAIAVEDLPPMEQDLYYESLWSFAHGLQASHNTTRATIFASCLRFWREERGRHDWKRFHEYLALPRNSGSPFLYDRNASNYASDQRSVGPVHCGNTTQLITEYIKEAFGRAGVDSIDEFKNQLDATWLTRTLAAVKVTSEGCADNGALAKWLPSLSSYEQQQLKDKVELSFVDNAKSHAVADGVQLSIVVKNVSLLSVKVFRINTAAYYKSKTQEVDATLDLDGLTAHHEFTKTFKENASPYERLRRSLDLSFLAGQRGVFVVELLGNGSRNRAVLRKGGLTCLDEPTSAGHSFTLFNELGQPVQGGSVWIAGHTYSADPETGRILAPYTNNPNSHQPILLTDAANGGGHTVLSHFNWQKENYSLSCGMYVDREALLSKSTAELVVRPALFVNGVPASLSKIVKCSLKLESTNHDGVSSSAVVEPFALSRDGKETVHPFTVPDNLRSLRFVLSCEVQRRSSNSRQSLSAQLHMQLNEMADKDFTEDLYLRQDDTGYVVCFLGKTGEARSFRDLTLSFDHALCPGHSLTQTLQTDYSGKVSLGSLPHVNRLSVSVGSLRRSWNILADRSVSRPSIIHAAEGEEVVVSYPFPSNGGNDVTSHVSLLERRGQLFHADHTLKSVEMRPEQGAVVLKALGAGTYELSFKSLHQPTVHVVVARGPSVDGARQGGRWVVEPGRFVQLFGNGKGPVSSGMNIAALRQEGGDIVVRLAGHSKHARVHVIATHFVPEEDAAMRLASSPALATASTQPVTQPRSLYASQKNLGDEYQYILDRRARHGGGRVGCMLPRPSLLLNERERGATSFDSDPVLRSGQDYGSSNLGSKRDRAARSSRMMMSAAACARSSAGQQAGSACLEFLAEPSERVLNLRPDADGKVSIPRVALGDTRSHLVVVAVDGVCTASARMGLARVSKKEEEKKRDDKDAMKDDDDGDAAFVLDPAYRDTRLWPGLDPSRHSTEQHRITLLEQGQQLHIADIQSATVETYDTLADVFNLYRTLLRANGSSSVAADLEKFSFLAGWASLSAEEKAKKYSELACHELHFFLWQKDRPFFDEVVRPFLANKLCRTFVDEWLLGGDLSRFLAPGPFAQLNAFEAILLSQRIDKGGASSITRMFTDKAQLLARDPEAFARLFKAALASRALEAGEGKGLVPQKERKAPRPKMMARDMEVMSTMAMPPPAPGGGGGGRSRMKKKSMAKSRSRRQEMMVEEECDDEEEECEADEFDDDDDSFGALPKRLYQEPPTTKELEEHNYYNVANGSGATTGLVRLNRFWADYAVHVAGLEADKGEKGKAAATATFLSQHLAEAATGTFAEALLAVCVLDLPFEATKHSVETDRVTRFELTAASPMVVFHKEVLETEQVPSSVTVTSSFFDPADRFDDSGPERVDKYIRGELLVETVYGCRVVLTNVSSTQQKLEVLQQVPAGSVPVSRGGRKAFYTHTSWVTVGGFSTEVLEYFFYFPAVGTFRAYPVHVAKRDRVVGHGEPCVLSVVAERSEGIDLTSWKVLSQQGTSEQVLGYMREHNLHKLTQSDIRLILWRMKERDFFLQALAVMRERRYFSRDVWAFSMYHCVADSAGEYLGTRLTASELGPFFSCGLVHLDTEASEGGQRYQHLEYSPLINARAHRLRTAESGGGRGGGSGGGTGAAKIQNRQLRGQYHQLLKLLAHRAPGVAAYGARHKMALAYYLLLQDRVEEASKMFAMVKAPEVEGAGRLQWDYMHCYLQFFSREGPVDALATAKRYRDYPVLKKRKIFRELEEQMFEAAPGAALQPDLQGGEDQSREREMDNLAAMEPSVDFTIENSKTLRVVYENLTSVTVNYFAMDLEQRFSHSPFINQQGSADLFVAPNHSMTVELSPGDKVKLVDVPKQFHNACVYVQVDGRSKPLFSNSLSVQILENYGQVKLTNRHTGHAVPGAYVKVYARSKNNGGTSFYKDGYTDRRGRFDYSSLSTNKLKDVERFAVLLLSDGLGAVVREASPPAI